MTVDRNLLFAQLEVAVERLNAPAEEQVAYLRALGVLPSADELALEFGDVAPAAVIPGSGLTTAQRAAVEELDEVLDTLSGPEYASLWTVDGLRSDPRWARIRSTAATALHELRRSGPPLEPPPRTS